MCLCACVQSVYVCTKVCRYVLVCVCTECAGVRVATECVRVCVCTQCAQSV
jgi:hypothetical protein